MALTRVRLPVDSDLSPTSVAWAAALLNETPQELVICERDVEYVPLFGDIAIRVDPAMPTDAWLLIGSTREVYSDGA